MTVLTRLCWWTVGCLYFLLSSRIAALSTEFSSLRSLSLRKRLIQDEIDITKITTEAFSWVDNSYFVNSNTSYYNYTGYNTYQAIRGELYRLEEQNPGFVKVEVFGKTIEDRELLALHINQNNSTDIVIISSLVHAREWIAGCVTMEYMYKLLLDERGDTNEASDIELLLKSYHFIIIPVVNPDGYAYTFTKNRFWRKNREHTIGGLKCRGTDINRNFRYGYTPYIDGDEASERGPCSDSYPGAGVLKTKEAAAVDSILNKYKHNIRYYIDYHMYGNDWVYSYGHTKSSPKNRDQLDRYAANAAKVLNNMTNDEWSFGAVADVIYKCHGIMVDHAHYYITPIAFTVEVGKEESDFRAPDTDIPYYTASQWAALVSNLKMLHDDLKSTKYMVDRTRNWRITNMVKR